MVEEKPVVVMEELDAGGNVTGEMTKGKSLAVVGKLHSNKQNQLVLTTSEKTPVDNPDAKE